jgi:hypothetical protein
MVKVDWGRSSWEKCLTDGDRGDYVKCVPCDLGKSAEGRKDKLEVTAS